MISHCLPEILLVRIADNKNPFGYFLIDVQQIGSALEKALTSLVEDKKVCTWIIAVIWQDISMSCILLYKRIIH